MDKIIFVIYGGLDIGGVQTVMMNIVRNLHEKYIFDAVITTNNVGEYEKEFQLYGGKIFRIPCLLNDSSTKGRIDFYIRWKRIRKQFGKILKDNGPYIAVHSNFNEETGLFLDIAKKNNIPIRIFHRHGLHEGNKPVNFVRQQYTKYLDSLTIKSATDYVGCTEGVCKAWFSDRSYQVIHNFLSPEYYNRSKHDSNLRKWDFVHIGRFCETKNQLFVVKVFDQIHNVHPEAKLTLVGANDSEYTKIVQNKICELKLEKDITIVPLTRNVIKYYENNSFMIFPSLYEGFGIALLEAQVMGVYCFPSDSVPCECDVGNCSFMQLQKNEIEWANSILDIVENRISKYKNYSEMGQFSRDEIIKKYDDLYSLDDMERLE